jgi:hypothetical protein
MAERSAFMQRRATLNMNARDGGSFVVCVEGAVGAGCHCSSPEGVGAGTGHSGHSSSATLWLSSVSTLSCAVQMASSFTASRRDV